MMDFGICVPLAAKPGCSQLYFFPSLLKETFGNTYFDKITNHINHFFIAQIQFTLPHSPQLQFAGVEYAIQGAQIFIPGFYHQLIMDLFRNLNVSTKLLFCLDTLLHYTR